MFSSPVFKDSSQWAKNNAKVALLQMNSFHFKSYIRLNIKQTSKKSFALVPFELAFNR